MMARGQSVNYVLYYIVNYSPEMKTVLFLTEGGPKTLAEVAKECADKDGPKSPDNSPEKQQLTLAEAAIVYQEKVTPCKSQLEQVEVVTGEEKERNVMHVSH
jgi:hypothetical protein